MIRVKIGGFPFMLPQSWSEVSPYKAKRLSQTSPEDIQDRLHILGHIPSRKAAKIDAAPLLAIYEIVSFIEEIPELTTNILPNFNIQDDWSFVEFESARREIMKHKNELGVCLYTLAEIKGHESNYVEAGVKILDGINKFLDQFGILDDKNDDDEPTALEEAAGIDRLKVFGVFNMLDDIARDWGKTPQEIEQMPVGLIYTKYYKDRETHRYQENYSKLSSPK